MALNDKRILITGGTGSLGKKLVEIILKRYPDVKRLVIFSRDELKQFEMSQEFPEDKYPCIRYFLGDIRDAARLKKGLRKCRCSNSCSGVKTSSCCRV
jgi:FlaA1/EpsC-like NDP-sugar epimerase